MGVEQRGETPLVPPGMSEVQQQADRKIELDVSNGDGPAVKVDMDVVELAGLPIQVIPHPDIENGKAILIGPLFLALPLEPGEGNSLPELQRQLAGGVILSNLDQLRELTGP